MLGEDQVRLAADVVNETRNNMSRYGGFAPIQWVLGKFPRAPGSQFDENEFANLGYLEAQQESGTEFALQCQYRLSAQEAFVHEDCGKRVGGALLRKAAPLQGSYAVGDVICFQKEHDKQGADRWSTAPRIAGERQGRLGYK